MAHLPATSIVAVFALVAMTQCLPSFEDRAPLLKETRETRDSFTRQVTKSSRADASRSAVRLAEAFECSTDDATYTIPKDVAVAFHSPNYPERYSPNSKCSWTFETDAGLSLDLDCNYVSIQHNDFLRLYDLESDTHSVVNAIYGLPMSHSFQGNRARIEFETNDKGESAGFQCFLWPVSVTP